MENAKLHARAVAETLLAEHPVLSRYHDHLTVLIVGSIGAGFADELSDVDIWVMCSDEAVADLSTDLQRSGLRFMVPPPNDISIGGVEAHYFVFPIDKLRDAAEGYDDESLFVISHCLVVHDPSRQFQAMRDQFANLPSSVVADKVDTAYTLVAQRSRSVSDMMKRYQPLAWLEHSCHVIHAALELCCWLDGQAPTGRKWLMEQARGCSAALILLPAVMQFIHAIGPSLTNASRSTDSHELPLSSAARTLEEAAFDAVKTSGFGAIPRCSLPKAHP